MREHVQRPLLHGVMGMTSPWLLSCDSGLHPQLRVGTLSQRACRRPRLRRRPCLLPCLRWACQAAASLTSAPSRLPVRRRLQLQHPHAAWLEPRGVPPRLPAPETVLGTAVPTACSR